MLIDLTRVNVTIARKDLGAKHMKGAETRFSNCEVELWPIKRLKPYDNNPRQNDRAVSAVAESIKRYGFRQPIVVDPDGLIIVGHTRWKAAKKLKLKVVPVHVAHDLTPEEARAYRIADNKTGELAIWDYPLLRLELSQLKDIPLPGFTDTELKKILDKEAYRRELREKYVRRAEKMIYTPKRDKPPRISELFDDSRAQELLKYESQLPEELRPFWRAACYRHCRFRFDQIAEYYAHAPKEIQRLFEECALVIVDAEFAFKKGWLSVTESVLDELLGDS